jgi:outer membrane biogenesis lipoprotein LolB
MKKVILSIAVVALLVACSTNTTKTTSCDTCKKDSVCLDSTKTTDSTIKGK